MITFDPATHTYYNGGQKWPSVTQLLPNQNGLRFLSERRLLELSTDGKTNHAAVANMMETGETFSDPYLEGIKKELSKYKNVTGNFRGSESIVWSERNEYAGTLDLLYDRSIIDVKRTLGNKKIHALQLIAYMFAAEEMGMIRQTENLFVITGKETGKAKLVNVYDRDAENMFALCLRRHKEKDINIINDIDETITRYLKQK